MKQVYEFGKNWLPLTCSWNLWQETVSVFYPFLFSQWKCLIKAAKDISYLCYAGRESKAMIADVDFLQRVQLYSWRKDVTVMGVFRKPSLIQTGWTATQWQWESWTWLWILHKIWLLKTTKNISFKVKQLKKKNEIDILTSLSISK